MREYIAFDSHKRYTWVEREEVESGRRRSQRVEHARGAIRRYLAGCEPDTPVALEATANWYWIVSEIEQAGLRPLLVHPRKAKLMMRRVRPDTPGVNPDTNGGKGEGAGRGPTGCGKTTRPAFSAPC